MFVRWAQFCAMGTIIRFHTNSCCDHRPAILKLPIKTVQHLAPRRVLLSNPSTVGAGGPTQNTSRIQHEEAQPTFYL